MIKTDPIHSNPQKPCSTPGKIFLVALTVAAYAATLLGILLLTNVFSFQGLNSKLLVGIGAPLAFSLTIGCIYYFRKTGPTILKVIVDRDKEIEITNLRELIDKYGIAFQLFYDIGKKLGKASGELTNYDMYLDGKKLDYHTPLEQLNFTATSRLEIFAPGSFSTEITIKVINRLAQPRHFDRKDLPANLNVEQFLKQHVLVDHVDLNQMHQWRMSIDGNEIDPTALLNDLKITSKSNIEVYDSVNGVNATIEFVDRTEKYQLPSGTTISRLVSKIAARNDIAEDKIKLKLKGGGSPIKIDGSPLTSGQHFVITTS